MEPKVSVITPVYNAERYIKKTIECVLSQTFSDFELVLIDDKPTDSTMDIVNSFNDNRIRIIRNEQNMGIAYSRNVGLKNARAKYIALMDDDDLCPDYRLQCEYDFLEQNPHIDAVGGGFRIINDKDEFVSGVTPTLQNPGYVRAQLMFYCTMYNGSTMFRKRIVDEHNIRYLDNYLGMEDYRFWVEFARYGKMTNATDALLYWRQAPTTETIKVLNNKVEEREERFASIQRYAIESQGFELTEEEVNLFTTSFMEHKRKKEDKGSLNNLYRLFRKMIDQANEKKMDNAKEIMQACRNRFLEKVKESTIWE